MTYSFPIPPERVRHDSPSALKAAHEAVTLAREAALLAFVKTLFPSALKHGYSRVSYQGGETFPRVEVMFTDSYSWNPSYLQLTFENGWGRYDKTMRRLKLTKVGETQTVDKARADAIGVEFEQLARDHFARQVESTNYREQARLKRIDGLAEVRAFLDSTGGYHGITLSNVNEREGVAEIELPDAKVTIMGNQCALSVSHGRDSMTVKLALIPELVALFRRNGEAG